MHNWPARRGLRDRALVPGPRRAPGKGRLARRLPTVPCQPSDRVGRPGKAVRWRSWCGQHDRDALRPVLRQLVGGCMPGRPQHRISAEDLIALASRDLPKTAYRVAMLQMAGISPREARAMLKIPESTYYDTLRVLGERRR